MRRPSIVSHLSQAFLIASVLCCGASTDAATFHVAKNGNDSDSGTAARPWLTLGKGAGAARAGDTVLIHKGLYKEILAPKNSGASGRYITFAAVAGDSVTLDGTAMVFHRARSWGMVQIDHLGYICIRGLRIINAPFFGIASRVSHHLIITNNYVYNTVYSGIITWQEEDSTGVGINGLHNNVIVDSNEVVLACNDGPQEIISLCLTDTFQVSNNHVHHGGPGSVGGEGIDVKCSSNNGRVFNNYVHHLNRQGIYVDACSTPTRNIEIFNNIVHDCRGQDGIDVGSESGGLLENIKVYNNLVYDNDGNGFRFAGWGNPVGPMRNITVINNTFVNNGKGTWGNRGGISVEASNVQNIVLRNNIMSGNVQFQIFVTSQAVSAVTADFNLISPFRGMAGEIRGTSGIEKVPGFVNAVQKDFHLAAGSPAIDAGSSVNAPTVDLDGRQRQSSSVDLGAYEWIETVSAAVTPQSASGKTPKRPLRTIAHSNVLISVYGDQGAGRLFDISGRRLDRNLRVTRIGQKRLPGH